MCPADNQQPICALLVNTVAAGEADSLVSFFSAEDGALTALARGLRKSTSKLAASLLPADELDIRLASGRGRRNILIGAATARGHPEWRAGLDLLSLYWFMAECLYLSAGEPEINAAMYRLAVNILRHPPTPEVRCSAAAVFALKLQMLHGLLPDLAHCALDGHLLADNEPVHLLPSGEGVIGREAYNRHYARTGGGLVRLEAQRLYRWRRLLGGALLDYREVPADAVDVALLVHHLARAVGDVAGRALHSAAYMRAQWKLPDLSELLQAQN